MAKGKHAAALFEVIHSGRHSTGTARGSLLTPKWWFKRKPSSSAPATAGTAARTVEPPATAESSAPPAQELDPSARVRAAAAKLEAEEHGAPAATSSTPSENGGVAVDPGGSDPSASPGLSSIAMLLDRDRQQITFKITYSGAIVTGFAVLVVVALAYVVGRKMSAGPSLAVASETSEQLRAGPANPNVLEVLRPSGNGGQPAGTSGAGPQGGRIAEIDTRSRVSDTAGAEARPGEGVQDSTGGGNRTADGLSGARTGAPSPSISSPGARQVNLNYIIIQSYPDEKGAIDARDALINAGVHCTIEQGLRGLRADWFSVVGTQGFVKPSSADCQAYISRIRQISEQFAASKRSFKAFQPLAYKWDKAVG